MDFRGAALAGCLLCTGCSGNAIYLDNPHTLEQAQPHLVQFDKFGEFVAPLGAKNEPDSLDAGAAESPEASQATIEENNSQFRARPRPAPDLPQTRLNLDSLTQSDIEDRFELLRREIEEFTCTQSSGDEAECRMFLFFHGGLTTYKKATQRALAGICNTDGDELECVSPGPAEQDGFFPLYVGWDSSFTTSYWGHLTRVQRGRAQQGWTRFIGLPFKFLADTGKALSRWVITAYEMYSHDLKTNGKFRLKTNVEASSEDAYAVLSHAHERAESNVDGTSAVKVDRCIGDTSVAQKAWATASYAATFLTTKPLTMPVVDGLGSVSWDVMLRRIDLLFEREAPCSATDEEQWWKCACTDVEGSPVHPDESAPCGSTYPVDQVNRVQLGGLSQYLQRLRQILSEDGRTWKITLIGHSMGGILANRVLDKHVLVGDPTLDPLPVVDVVYLASAAQIGDTRDTTLAFLRSDPNNRVFHLVLDPGAELRERKFMDLPPRGSLLVWIDNFLSKPNSMEQRTSGRFANLTRMLTTLPTDVRDRTHLRVFGVGKQTETNPVPKWHPQRHGQFASRGFPYWRESYWFPLVGGGCAAAKP